MSCFHSCLCISCHFHFLLKYAFFFCPMPHILQTLLDGSLTVSSPASRARSSSRFSSCCLRASRRDNSAKYISLLARRAASWAAWADSSETETQKKNMTQQAKIWTISQTFPSSRQDPLRKTNGFGGSPVTTLDKVMKQFQETP